MLMGKYVFYLVEHNILTNVTNEFWRKALKGNIIPLKILDKMKLKWGLGIEDIDVITYYSNNPIALSSFNSKLLEAMKKKLDTTDICGNFFHSSTLPDASFNQENVFDQLLESNMDLFSTIIGDSLGDLPII
ncbi:hypothetical protein NCAS_0A03080 [Naumovozyma castellii]|uniref:Uncharacterized protein n=1 Tax=Naumovozyma castellii TaxID=27288 RepID=G0V5X8_NAUCA|nr:hypothetical protein NCAS_0A03080 [Naumovozyma castellii CBS 4309]CCC66866.1 hypothetical protein NCAS_0A03080 [Naumovozyma castellii CBS 4309]